MVEDYRSRETPLLTLPPDEVIQVMDSLNGRMAKVIQQDCAVIELPGTRLQISVEKNQSLYFLREGEGEGPVVQMKHWNHLMVKAVGRGGRT